MIGGFGKIPAKPDFIRVGHSDATTRGFESWLDDACLRVRESGLELPEASIRFVMRPSGATHACIGALRPSRDAIGRRFPISVFHMLMWPEASPRWSALPVAVDPFLESADALLLESARLDHETLRSRTTSLWTPGADDLASTDEICRRVLAETPWGTVAERVFPAPAADRACYAFRTALTACERVATQPIAIDCPIQTDVDLFFWLELFRRFSRADSLMYLWVEEPSPRLVVALGPPPTQMLLAAIAPDREISQVWPLTTTRSAALEAAVAALSPLLEPVRDGTAPLGALFDVLSRVKEGP